MLALQGFAESSVVVEGKAAAECIQPYTAAVAATAATLDTASLKAVSGTAGNKQVFLAVVQEPPENAGHSI